MQAPCLSLWLKRRIFTALVLLGGCAGGAQAQVQTGYQLEQGHPWVVQQLEQQTFTPFRDHLRLGFKRQAVWIRIDLAPDTVVPAQRRIVRVGPQILDQIDLFEEIDGQWRGQIAGDQRGRSTYDCGDDFHCFALQLPSNQAGQVYLRVKNEGLLNVALEVLTEDSLRSVVAHRVKLITSSVTIALCLTLLSWVLLAFNRTWLFASYALFATVVVMQQLATTGLWRQLAPDAGPAWASVASDGLILGRVIATLVFTSLALLPYKPSAGYRQCVGGFLTLSLLNFLWIAVGQNFWALQINLAIFMLIPPLQIYGLKSAKDIEFKYALVFYFGYLMYFILTIPAFIYAFNLIDNFTYFLSSTFDAKLNGLPVSLVFLMILFLDKKKQNAAIQQEKVELESRVLLAQRNQDQLQERHALIDLLTHELKNPLATVGFALASLKEGLSLSAEALHRVQSIRVAVHRMDKLLDHVVCSNKIETATWAGPPEAMDAADFLDDLISEHAPNRLFKVLVPDHAVFDANRFMLTVMVQNLLSNAVQYSLQGVPITLEVKLGPAGAVELAISNQVAPQNLPDEARLFERYYRHPASHEKPGMGLGLSLVRSAAEKIKAQVLFRQQGDWVFFTVRMAPP